MGGNSLCTSAAASVGNVESRATAGAGICAAGDSFPTTLFSPSRKTGKPPTREFLYATIHAPHGTTLFLPEGFIECVKNGVYGMMFSAKTSSHTHHFLHTRFIFAPSALNRCVRRLCVWRGIDWYRVHRNSCLLRVFPPHL